MKKLLLFVLLIAFNTNFGQFHKQERSLTRFIKKANQINDRFFRASLNTNYQALVNSNISLPNGSVLLTNTYAYDNYGRNVLDEEILYDPSNNTIVNKEKTEYFYDTQEGWLDYSLEYEYDTSTSQYNLTLKNQIVSYNANLRLPIQVVEMSYQAGTWLNENRYIYTYDANGNVLTETEQDWDGANWVNNNYTHYIYDNNQLLNQEIFYDWNNNTWEVSTNFVYTYDTQNRLIEKTRSNMVNNSPVNTDKDIYSYNANGKLSQKETQTWDGTQWQSERRTNWSYDSNDNITTEIIYEYNNGVWEESEKTEFTSYDNAYTNANLLLPEDFDPEEEVEVDYFHHQLNDVVVYEWSSGSWQAEINVHLSYQTLSIADVDTIDFAKIKIYPNPSVETLNIDTNKNLLLDMFDITGKKVLSTNLLSKHNQINISHLQAGVYLATISSNNNSATIKIVVK